MINISRDDLNNYKPISIDTKFAVVYDVDDEFMILFLEIILVHIVI